jgi:hypothetical protein
MNFPAIPASDPLVSLHPDDTPAAAIPQGNGIPALAVFEATMECGKRQLLRDIFDNAVTAEELWSSKRRKIAVDERANGVHYGVAPPVGDWAVVLAALNDFAAVINANLTALTATVNENHDALNALTATVNANHATATANHATATANHHALTATVNTMAIGASNNQKVQHGIS